MDNELIAELLSDLLARTSAKFNPKAVNVDPRGRALSAFLQNSDFSLLPANSRWSVRSESRPADLRPRNRRVTPIL